ncbi:MAG: beta-xylosidase [Anaerocolumna sp.]
MINFKIDKNIKTDFPHYWEMCVGSCHAYTALREDYRKQLKRAHEELGFQYVRFHGLLDDDMCVLIMKKDFMGNELGLVYNFVNIDNICDFLLSIGMKPFFELGFMPSVLASEDKTVFHYKGNITPPKDYDAWAELIRRLTEHFIERYGLDEVAQWYFEVWNEPNLAVFFSGTKEEYFKMYEVTAQAIKQVNSNLKVGGPATSCNSWIKDMVNYCEKNKVPLDFISTHHYPTDDPLWRSGMDITDFFKSGLAGKGAYERGILSEMTKKAREEAGDYPLYYTEWNTSAMTNADRHDEGYASAMIAKTLADNDGLVQGYSYWTFTDIFEESSQIPGAFHDGFGLLTYAGIAKPAYRLFELFHGLGRKRLKAECDEKNSTVELLATETDNGYRLAVYNHNIPEGAIKDEAVTIHVSGMVRGKDVMAYRIDEDHVNVKRLWIKMGSPEYLKPEEVEILNAESVLKAEKIKCDDIITLMVPPHGVVVIDL